jgi:hypothetical protein
MSQTSKKNPKTKRRTDQKTNEMTTQRFLVVADIGPDADYTTEPRHFFEVAIHDPDPKSRSPKRKRIFDQSMQWRSTGFPSAETPMHMCWVDPEDRPLYFMNVGATLNQKLLPMVSCEQKMHTTTILMQLYGEVTVDFEGNEDEQGNAEYEVLTEYFDDLFHNGIWDSDLYDDELRVVGYGWKEVEIELPFECSETLTPTQIQYALDVAHEEARLGCIWDTYTDIGIEPCAQAWVTQKGDPVLCLHGLMDLRKGEISRQKFQAICKAPAKHIPAEVLKAC